jgi:site-specific recombinase XerC
LTGLRDRALIALMGYTFARVGAVINMKVEDYYIQKRRGWVWLHEKGGKVNELPCHHSLEQFLDEWLNVSGLSARIEVAARVRYPVIQLMSMQAKLLLAGALEDGIVAGRSRVAEARQHMEEARRTSVGFCGQG